MVEGNIPLLMDDAPVLLYNGNPKARQDVHAAVLDLSVGTRDLQQCADAVIRLRAEYLIESGREDEIAFNLQAARPLPLEGMESRNVSRHIPISLESQNCGR